jgi:glycosyltransferase involved in cell wall biosynthesis
MNIVLAINHFQPQIGYQEFFLCNEWQKLGHQVTVVTSNYYFPFPEYEKSVQPILGERKRKIGQSTERGIKTIRLPAGLTLNGMVLTLSNLTVTLKRLQPDVVFGDGVYYPLAWQLARLKNKLNYQLIFDTHASTFNTQLRDTLPKKLYMLLFKFFCLPLIKQRADGFTAVGTSEKALLISEYNLQNDRVQLIALGADTTLFASQSSLRRKMRTKFSLKESDLVFIYAGKLTPEKDITILVDAFIEVGQKYDHVYLFIVGGGASEYLEPIKAKLSKYPLISNRVKWIDPQPQAKLAELYNLADVGVWPGNLTNTIQEAMACNLPVILSKNISEKQTTDHFKYKNSVIQCQRGQANSFAQAMIKYVDQPKLMVAAGKDSREFVENTCSWKIIAQHHLAVYEKSCTKKI